MGRCRRRGRRIKRVCVRAMLATALKVAGSRGSEVDKIKREFEAALQAARKKTPAPKPAPPAVPVVVKLQLIDLETKKPVPGFDPLRDGATIDLSKRSADQLEIRAIVKGAPQNSVRFDLDGNEKFQVENWRSFDLHTGKAGPRPWAKAGKHIVTVVPYSLRDLKGIAGKKLSVTFTIIGK